jgi:hypothetical protein
MRSAFGRARKLICSAFTNTLLKRAAPLQPAPISLGSKPPAWRSQHSPSAAPGGPGLRTIGFERRATIAFQVMQDEVVILRIFYGGEDYERALRRSGGGAGSP